MRPRDILVSCEAPPRRSAISGVMAAKASTRPPSRAANSRAPASLAKLASVGPMEPRRLLPIT